MTEDFLNLDYEYPLFDSYQQNFSGSSGSDDTLKVTKKISKYEPILDNHVLYRYEDNPEQYKKIRKKQQNRESANRVRGKQRNYMHDLEKDFNALKSTNQELSMNNAKLLAENALLKQQVQFMQEVILQSKSINPPLQMERTSQFDKNHILSLTGFTTLLCLVLIVQNYNNQSTTPTAGEAITGAAQIDTIQPVVEKVIETSYKPYLIGAVITAWLIYGIYVVYQMASGKKLKNKLK